MKTSAVKGVPMLKKKQPRVCGSCQSRKQQRASHKVIQDRAISKVLQLLHMDLIGPMQVKSMVERRYAFVCVDDFFKYIQVDFIKEKLDTFDVFRKLCEKVKTNKIAILSELEVIIEENLKTLVLRNIVV